MPRFKIHMGPDGIKGWGPNTPEYQPNVVEGDTLEYSDTMPTQSVAERFNILRMERDARLRATDKYLLADYPISADALAQVKVYRAALRALPEQPGAPWPGGDIPWPVMPQI